MKKVLRKICNLIDINEIFILTGIALAGYGIWKIYQPAAFFTIGLGLVAWGYTGIRSKK